MRACRFEHGEGPAQIGLKHRSRRKNAAVDMRLGSEMDDHIRVCLSKRLVHECGIANIAMHEAITRFVRH